jgi:glucokinase
LPRLESKSIVPTAQIGDLAAAIREFLSSIGGPRPKEAVFAVAAPILGDTVALTNAPLRFSAASAKEALGLERLLVVNDFAAMARGAAASSQLTTIKSGAPVIDAPRVVLGPGTGLGVAILIGDEPVRAVPTQGGHAAFAPQTEFERSLWSELHEEFGDVSFEHVVSGPGLSRIHRALHRSELSPTALTKAASDGDDAALKTFDVFFEALGTFAADAALMTGARGGVILAGGILPRVEKLLAASHFNERFVARPAMAGYLRAIPVKLLTDSDAALIGAALLGEGN